MTSAMAKRIVRRDGPRRGRRFTCVLALISIALMGAAHDPGPIRAEPKTLELATPELIERLRADPYDYFRFVNRSWIARVCDDFSSDLEGLPVVRLHGDAHVEQFALAKDAWGLDDFDDSARGPAVVGAMRRLLSLVMSGRRIAGPSGERPPA